MTRTIEGVVEEVFPLENSEQPGFTKVRVKSRGTQYHTLNVATRQDMSYLKSSGILTFWVGGSIPDLPNHDSEMDKLYQSDEIGGIADSQACPTTFLPLKIYSE